MRQLYTILFAFAFSIQAIFGQTEPEKATIYFARAGFQGSAINMHMFDASGYLGALRGKKLIKVEVSPGEHTFCGVFPAKHMTSTLSLDVEPGETYYVLGKMKALGLKDFLFDATDDKKLRKKVLKKIKKGEFEEVTQEEEQKFQEKFGERVALALGEQNNVSESVASASYLASTENTPAVTTASTSPSEDSGATEFAGNKRELALQEILKNKGVSGGTAATVFSQGSSVIDEEEKVEKIKHSEDNTSADLKYRRSSLYTMMINDKDREHFGVIRDAFGNFELSEKFNDHNIGPYLINAEGGEKDQSEVISSYLEENGVARNLVAKWFNRNSKGEFSMDLVASRGSYNASDLDVMVARDSKRGAAILADAGEELIGNTFVIVNDYRYVNKEEVASKASGILSIVSDAASVVGADNVALIADAANLTTTALGKGYVVKTTSYLYRLEWNEEVASKFYNTLWIDSRNYDPAKKEAFETTDLFKLRLVGAQSAWADLQSTAFTKKSDQDLIRIATVKATNKGISKLQRKFEEFRTKSPLLSGDPIAAKIGLKEGLEKGDKFEVLEQYIDEDGRTHYKRVGKIKVDKKHIWDNTFMSDETGENTGEEYTVFKGKEGKYYSGMLIRQIN